MIQDISQRRKERINFKSRKLMSDRIHLIKQVLEVYLGLEILAESPAGANRVIAHRVSAALACTSGESWKSHSKGMYSQCERVCWPSLNKETMVICIIITPFIHPCFP